MKNTLTTLSAIAIFFFLTIEKSFAQCPPMGLPAPSDDCFTSLPVCAGLDGYCGTLPIIGFPQNFPGCPSNVLDNDQWISFFAGTDSIAIEIIPSNCQAINGNVGMQAAIYQDSCTGLAIATQCTCFTAPFILESADFEVGHQYFLVLDGCSADICDYQINVLFGSTAAPPISPPSIDGLTEVCPGLIANYTSTSTDILSWTIEPLSPGVDVSFIGPSTGNSVDILWATEGTAEICVIANNLCETDTTCMVVTSNPVPMTTEVITACQGDCVECGGVIFCGTSGVFEIVDTTALGCDSIITCIIEFLPTDLVFLEVTSCAPDSIEICGTTFNSTGLFSETCVNQNGCDSLVNVLFTLLDPVAIVDPVPPLPAGDTVVLVGTGSNFVDPFADSTIVEWTGPGLISNVNEIVVEANLPGTYCLSITHFNDGISCTDQTCIEVEIANDCSTDPLPDLGPDLQLCNNDTFRLDAGTGYSAYFWSTGELTQSIPIFQTGSYSVTVSDTLGCTGADTLMASFNGPVMVDLGEDIQLCQNDSATLDAGAGFVQYEWNTGDTSQSIIIFQAGNYSVTVTDTLGCIGIDTILVAFYDPILVDLGDDIQFCENDSTILDAGMGYAQYAWSTGDSTQTITITQPGRYDVKVTDSLGCMGVDTILTAFYAPILIDLGSDRLICIDDSTTIDAGSGFVEYLWNTGDTTQSITTSQAGTYIVTVYDTLGCSAADTINISIDLPIVDLGDDIDICENTGTALVANSGFVDYIWNTGDTMQIIPVNMSGTYSVTVTNANGCTGQDSIDVSVSANPVLNIDTTYLICPGDSLFIDAGPGFSTYQWNTGDTSQVLTVLASGIYSVIVSNQAGCTATGTIEVVSPPAPSGLLPPDSGFCEGEVITLSALPGFSKYLWSTGDSTETIAIDSPGVYSIIVMDLFGCTFYDTTTVEIYSTPVFDLGPDYSICPGDTATLDAGPGHQNYSWNTGENTQVIEVTTAGTYIVSETTSDGCFGSDEITISLFPNPVVDLGSDTMICDLELPFMVDAGAGFESYLWQDGSTEQTFTVIDDTISVTLSVVVTDSTGCTATDDITVTIDICDATRESILAGNLTLRPIPASEYTELTFLDFELGEYELVIYDVVGRTSMKLPHVIFSRNQNLLIDTREFAKGLYFLKISSEKGMLIKRLVIN